MGNVDDKELKLENWLDIITFDITKYVKHGGVVVVNENSDGALTITFEGVRENDERLYPKFLKMVAKANEPAVKEPAKEPEPALAKQ